MKQIVASNIKTFIQHPAVKFNSICKGNYWGFISVYFEATDHMYSALVKYLRKKWEYNEAAHQLFINF